jgi:hypothetical protein
VPADDLQQRIYGIDSCVAEGMDPAKLAALAAELPALRDYAQQPIQLDRPDCHITPLADKSWANEEAHVKQYLGFAWRWAGVADPMLQLYCEPHVFASFAAFLLVRQQGGGGRAALVQHIETAKRVAGFLRAQLQRQQPAAGRGAAAQSPEQLPGSCFDDAHLLRVVEWLQRLQRQARKNLQPTPPRTLEQQLADSECRHRPLWGWLGGHELRSVLCGVCPAWRSAPILEAGVRQR